MKMKNLRHKEKIFSVEPGSFTSTMKPDLG